MYTPTNSELSLLTKQIDLLLVLWMVLFVCFGIFNFFFVEGSKFGNPDKKRAIEGHY